MEGNVCDLALLVIADWHIDQKAGHRVPVAIVPAERCAQDRVADREHGIANARAETAAGKRERRVHVLPAPGQSRLERQTAAEEIAGDHPQPGRQIDIGGRIDIGDDPAADGQVPAGAGRTGIEIGIVLEVDTGTRKNRRKGPLGPEQVKPDATFSGKRGPGSGSGDCGKTEGSECCQRDPLHPLPLSPHQWPHPITKTNCAAGIRPHG